MLGSGINYRKGQKWQTILDRSLSQIDTLDKNTRLKNLILFCSLYRLLSGFYIHRWIKISTDLFEGCYSVSLDLNVLPTVIKKSMKKRSVGMCQEMCYQEKMNLFAVKVSSVLICYVVFLLFHYWSEKKNIIRYDLSL